LRRPKIFARGVPESGKEKWKVAGRTIINKQQDAGLGKNNRKQQMQKEWESGVWKSVHVERRAAAVAAASSFSLHFCKGS
jgi:predicted acetyltransferase